MDAGAPMSEPEGRTEDEAQALALTPERLENIRQNFAEGWGCSREVLGLLLDSLAESQRRVQEVEGERETYKREATHWAVEHYKSTAEAQALRERLEEAERGTPSLTEMAACISAFLAANPAPAEPEPPAEVRGETRHAFAFKFPHNWTCCFHCNRPMSHPVHSEVRDRCKVCGKEIRPCLVCDEGIEDALPCTCTDHVHPEVPEPEPPKGEAPGAITHVWCYGCEREACICDVTRCPRCNGDMSLDQSAKAQTPGAQVWQCASCPTALEVPVAPPLPAVEEKEEAP